MTSKMDLGRILYQALAEPIGLVLRTGDFVKARQRLYTARTAAQDTALDGLQFRAWSGTEGNLVIVKDKIQVKQTEERT